MINLPRKLAAEIVGTAFLLATVVSSGVMAEQLAGGNVALALLGTTLPTGAILVVIISRAFTDSFSGIRPTDMPAFIVAQLLGAGVAMFVAEYLFGPENSD